MALDYANINHALAFVDCIDPQVYQLKVGKEMFTLYGAVFIRELHQRGFNVFLDLKFHDIPHTTARAVAAAAELGVWIVDIHASGGSKMMQAAKKALLPYGNDAPLLIAVTVLTSMESIDLLDIGIDISHSRQVENLAKLSQNCGLDGVVCSAWEAFRLKQFCGTAFKLIAPGIRPVGSISSDQRRTMTPKQALDAGVDYIVIGRPITESTNPVQTLNTILNSLI